MGCKLISACSLGLARGAQARENDLAPATISIQIAQHGRHFVHCTVHQVQQEDYGFDPDGVQHFNGDNFNEMSPSSTDPAYLAAWGDAMYAPLLEGAGSGARWFVQGWSLGHWPNEQLSA